MGAVLDAGVRAPFVVMQSNGGCVPGGRAEEQAHRLVLSGPAGGVSGLIATAKEHGLPNVISLDMGGTSADICLVRNNDLPFIASQTIQDHTLLAASVDIHTIGAGGGSIAWIDTTGRLRVGPQSAKAVPGPAAYGRGGTEPTVTDAHVVLGTLGGGELAGDLVLDREAAATAVDRVGQKLGMTTIEAAEAILAVSLAHMVRAVRKVSVERGLDPREFVLVPFGGAGPLHAGLILRHMGLKSALIPQQPGLFSADGLLVAGLRIDDSQTILKTYLPEATDELTDWFTEAAEAAERQLIADGASHEDISTVASVDCRYLGQGFELNVPLESWDADGLADLPDRFHELHETLYGHANREEAVEIVTVRIAATGEFTRDASSVVVEQGTASADDAIVERRDVHIPGAAQSERTAVYNRSRLKAGNRIPGPAIIQQMDATTVLLADQTATVAGNGDLIITEEKA
jgi:N-methylhydantoinase A